MAKIWKATFNAVEAGQVTATGFHYQWDGEAGSEEPSAKRVAEAIDAKLRSAYRAMVRDDGTVEFLRTLEELDPDSDAVPETYELQINQAGTLFSGTAGEQPYEMVALIHRKSGAAVKGAQSWCFTPSPRGGASISGGTWNTGSVPFSKWSDFAALLEDDIDIDDLLPVIHGTLHPVAYAKTRRRRGEEPYTFNITSCNVDARPRWLRSRGN